MNFRLLGILLLTVACGKQVNIDHTALEEASKLKTSTSFKEGSISKMSSGSTYISYKEKSDSYSYKVSENSSYFAKSFIATLPQGKTDVRFMGTASSGEMTISEIQRK